MSPTDGELMAKLRGGDRDAFARLIERYQRTVFGYLRARLRQGNDAEDLTQEVFLRCYEARARFDETALVQPWLLGIARNLLREHARKHRRRHEVAWTELCLELETTAPADFAANHDHELWLPECLDGLGPSAREAIERHYRQDQRLAEIAVEQHRSEGAVKLLLHRARQALRECLARKRAGSEHDRR